MDESLRLGLLFASVVLAIDCAVLSVFQMWKESRQTTAVIVFLSFQLVLVYLLLANWLLVALWGDLATLSLLIKSSGFSFGLNRF